MAASASDMAAAFPVHDVVALLDQVTEEARRYQRHDLAARLGRERERIQDPACHVLVVGEFKKGKSSLVNALLNARVCPPDADVATAVPTFVRYGARPSAAVRGEYGGTEGTSTDGAATPVPFAEIGSLATIAAGIRVRALEIAIPRRLLRDGLVLVDTPGVGGGLASAHAAATLRALVAADVVLFVSDASQEYTAPELDFLRQAVDLCPTAVCALTKIDFYPEWRRILELDREHLHRAGLDCEIVPLSAPLRHHGVRTGDRSLVAESGFPQLSALLRRSAGRYTEAALSSAVAAAHSGLTQLVALVSTEHEALSDPRGQDDRRARWLEARRRAEELKAGGSRWQQVLADRIGDLASNVDLDLAVRLRAVRKEAVERIGAGDPTRTWGQLEPWLYKRANEALLDHVRMIRDEADAVADEVAGQFGAAAAQLRVAVEVDVSGAAARDVELATVAADRSARLQVGLMAARGGSTGAIVTHTVGLVLGLALPMTLPATALVATVLARKTWRSARTSQLRALQAEAERAVAMYLDEVELVARKNSRDSVRQVQRQLRDVFSQRAAELYASTAQSLDALASDLQGDERSRQERLAGTGVELERLRARADLAGGMLDRLLAQEQPG